MASYAKTDLSGRRVKNIGLKPIVVLGIVFVNRY